MRQYDGSSGVLCFTKHVWDRPGQAGRQGAREHAGSLRWLLSGGGIDAVMSGRGFAG